MVPRGPGDRPRNLTPSGRQPVRVLILEDNPHDAEIVVRELQRNGYEPEWTRVETESEFLAELATGPDLILSDYSLPHFDGLRAVARVRAEGLDIPFILISGTLGEDAAVRAVKEGVDDYLLKGHLARLGPAVAATLEAHRVRIARREAEREARASEARFSQLAEIHSTMLDALPAHVALLDGNGVIIGVNEAWRKFARDNALPDPACGVGANYLDVCRRSGGALSDEAGAASDGILQVLAGERVQFALEYPCHAPSQRRWFGLIARELRRDKRAGAVVMHVDITDRRVADEQLRKLSMAVEQAAETIVITDTRGTIQYANPAFEKTSGYTAAEALGQNPRLLKSGKHDAEFYRQMWNVLRRGDVWRGHLVNRRKDGKHYEEEATISPMRDATGEVTNYVGVKRDVTHEVELESQFRQAQKMEAIGILAGGVAHDFNNILGVIQMQASLLQSEGGLSAEQTELADDIGVAVQRAVGLTRQLLLFSRKEVLQPRELDLNYSVSEMTRMLARILGQSITVQLKLATEPMLLQGDPGMMDQVLMNLAVNARDAMPHGGQLVVETSGVEIDESAAAQTAHARLGSFVRLSVSDTGTGIPPEHLARIFEPFFTTKGVGKGTGLGLSTVLGIVQQHHGWVDVQSEVGHGTTLAVYLPRLPEARIPQSMHQVAAIAASGDETVLLVEDELEMRTMISLTLHRGGYRVLEASTAVMALEIWNEHHTTIQLLLTDLMLPDGMSGGDLAQRLLQENPELRVIYMSGYSAEVVGKDLSLREGVNFLAKPFLPRKLAQIIRQSLAAPPVGV